MLPAPIFKTLYGAKARLNTPENRMQTELEELAMQERYTGFMPDKRAFEADLAASLEDIKADLPYDLEAYRANQASRGIYSGGEAVKYEYRDVVAPIARAMTSAVTRSKLAYSQQFQKGRFGEEQIRQNYVQAWMGWILENKRIQAQLKIAKMQNKGGGLGAIFGAVAGSVLGPVGAAAGGYISGQILPYRG